ncbi:hypothetical protein Tco_0544192 [Tanacetum coccineum]
MVLTEVSADTSDKVSLIDAILTYLPKPKLDDMLSYPRKMFGNRDLKNELLQCKRKISGDQVYGFLQELLVKLLNQPHLLTPFVHKRITPPSLKFLANLQKVNAVFINLKFVEQQLVPFYDHFKKHIQAANDTLFKEVKEYEQIFDDLEWCFTDGCCDTGLDLIEFSSGPSTSEKPKVLASGMYTNSSKYIPPPKRANWVKPTPLPKKKQVTFQEPPRTSNRPTQKPPVQQIPRALMFLLIVYQTPTATESRKPMPKSHTRNHRILPSTSVNARRAADHNRKLNVVDHNQFVIRSLKSVNTKTPQAKHSVNHTKQVWKATRNHNVNTTKTAWRPTRKVVGSVKPQWKPTGRHFALYDNCPLTRIMEPIVEPLELTPSVSSCKIKRFTGCINYSMLGGLPDAIIE